MIRNSPFQAWLIREEDFPRTGTRSEQLAFLIGYAVLAPNSHNTQPWKFTIHGNYVDVYLDSRRGLAFADRANRQGYISIGCAIQNFIIAATHFGLTCTKEYFPEDVLEDVVVRIFVQEGKKNNRDSLFYALTRRAVSRSAHLSKKIPAEVSTMLMRFREEKYGIQLVSDAHTKRKLSEIMSNATKAAFEDRVFKKELQKWVRSNITRKSDGMPMFGWNLTLPLSLLSSVLIRYVPAWYRSSVDRRLCEHSAALMVISADEDNKVSWVKTGELFERCALYCANFGISVSPLGGIIEHEQSKKHLKNLLGLTGWPVMFVRVGYPSRSVPHSPRRLPAELITVV